MSMYFLEDSLLEKISFIIKLIGLYESNYIISEELYYVLDILLNFDISKDKNFEWSNILERLKKVINEDLAFFTTDIHDLNQTPELFWEDKFRELLIELKFDLINLINEKK